jgi:hypothetical protein
MSMTLNKLNPVSYCSKAARILGAWILLLSSLQAQDNQVPQIEVPAEEIAQGHNKGVETWEGTLFGQDSYKPGSYAQIESVPNPGFEFENWEGENIGNPQEAKTFVTMKEHANIKPHYKRIWNVIAAPDNKEAGKVEGGGNYPDGSEVTLKVTPNEGFKFLGWEGKGIKEEEKEALETTITVDGDHDIIAKFENENQDENSGGGGGGGGGDSDQNQDQNQDQNENQDQENQDQQDQSDQNEDQQDQGDQEDQPQEPESGEEDPAEPDAGDEDQQNQDEQGGEEEQPQDPGSEQEAPAQETQADGQPVPMQMTPEEATRLLEAMEDGEKKLPLFIVTPTDKKKDPKKDW